MDKIILKVQNIEKSFFNENKETKILKDISFDVKEGEFVAIIGSSGSGKSTLLSIIAGLDTPTKGSVILDGQKLEKLNEDSLSEIRNKRIGFVFQSFFLVPSLNAFENVKLPQEIAKSTSDKRINKLLEDVGMGHRKNNYPIQLSGGEKQRIAIARALANDPSLIFADEPTGNLDSKNSKSIIELLVKLNEENKKTLIVVTHEKKIADIAKRVIEVSDGKIIKDSKK
jgi:putative ABC transport system ATP-binding protein